MANGETTVEMFWITGPFISEDLIKRTNLANLSADRYLVNAKGETNAVTTDETHVHFNSKEDYAAFEESLKEYALMAYTTWVSKLFD